MLDMVDPLHATPTGRVMLASMPKDAPERKGLGMSAGGARRVPRQEDVRVLTPRQIYDHLDRYVVAELLFKSGHSIDATERGIIFIDEIDKIARRSGSSRTGAGSRDIGGEGVQP